MALSLNPLPRTSSWDGRRASDPGFLRAEIQGPAAPPHLSGPRRRGPPSAGAAAPGFPTSRARGAGPRPRSAAEVRPRPTLAGVFPNSLFAAAMVPALGLSWRGSRFLSPVPVPVPPPASVSFPVPVPALSPCLSRGGGLVPGGDAGLGPALSAGPGTRESPTSVPWPGCASPPRSDPRATIHKFRRQVAKLGAGRSPARTRTNPQESIHLRTRPAGAGERGRELWALEPGLGASLERHAASHTEDATTPCPPCLVSPEVSQAVTPSRWRPRLCPQLSTLGLLFRVFPSAFSLSHSASQQAVVLFSLSCCHTTVF